MRFDASVGAIDGRWEFGAGRTRAETAHLSEQASVMPGSREEHRIDHRHTSRHGSPGAGPRSL
jgi:hypothetical protein